MTDPELRALAEAATPGPWQRGETGTTRNGEPSEPTHVIWNDRGQWSMVSGQGEQAKADAEFVAAANPPAVLALLDRVARADAIEAAARKLSEALDAGWSAPQLHRERSALRAALEAS